MRAGQLRSAAASAAIAVSVLAAAGCTGDRPMSEASAGSTPQIRPLRSAIVLEQVASQLRISPPPVGKPVTITSAAVNQIQDLPPRWSLLIELPAGERAALAVVSTRAVGHPLAVIVAGKAWAVALVQTPLPDGIFEIPGLTKVQANQLQRTLTQSG